VDLDDALLHELTDELASGREASMVVPRPARRELLHELRLCDRAALLRTEDSDDLLLTLRGRVVAGTWVPVKTLAFMPQVALIDLSCDLLDLLFRGKLEGGLCREAGAAGCRAHDLHGHNSGLRVCKQDLLLCVKKAAAGQNLLLLSQDLEGFFHLGEAVLGHEGGKSGKGHFCRN